MTTNTLIERMQSFMARHMIRHFAGIAEIVEDIEAAVSFYQDALGLDVERHSEGYALVNLPGVLHFGIWSRREAAQATYGDPEAAERIPLGFSVGFEVDNVESAVERISGSGRELIHGRKNEPWGQVTSRFLMPSASLGEIAETPWARRITQPMKTEQAE